VKSVTVKMKQTLHIR